MGTATMHIDPIEREWGVMSAPPGQGDRSGITWRRRLLGAVAAAMLSLALATPAPLIAMSGNDPGGFLLLVWLGLIGAPIVFLAGVWLAPLAFGSILEAALAIGSVAAGGGLALIATLAALSPSSGFSDRAVAFGLVLVFGFPFAIGVAIVLTIPLGALWARLLRAAVGSDRT
jgi:hypothetical protein